MTLGVEQGGTIFLIGSDKFGRDLWGRICMGARVSLAIGRGLVETAIERFSLA